jgi:formate hydrogenlyase subunit 3/multisubunit Na+/H+ antiporter MnhD subunit
VNASTSETLLVGAVVVPLGMAVAYLSPRLRNRLPALLWLGAIPALATAILAWDSPPFVVDPARFRFTFALDQPGAMLLGVAALLWLTAGNYEWAYLGKEERAGRFAVYWLLTLAGSVGVFIAGDLATFYITYTLASLPAWGLVVHDGTPRARRAAGIYLALAVLSEILLLLAFALLAERSPSNSLAVKDVVAALPTSPSRDLTVALLIAGFGLKAGLVPLHVWLPLAHPAAPMPASAVLSGVIIKAGIIGLIRFLPADDSLAGWGQLLAALGLFTAFYGVAVGVTQANPKTVLAYSSVSQMGVVTAVLGMGLASANQGAALAASFYAAHHVLAKGALFMAVGVVAATSARRLWPVLVPVAVIALGLGGLPLTGGALAKLAVKDILGYGIAGVLATLSAAGTTLLMCHFLHRVVSVAASDRDAVAAAGLTVPWLATALAAIAVPWVFYPMVSGSGWSDVFAPSALWAALWPVAVGAILAVALRRAEPHLPQVPEGDLVVLGPVITRAAGHGGNTLERAEALLRQWPLASVSLLALLILLTGMLLAGR